MLASSGETTPPWGVPVTGLRTWLPSMTPARSIARSSFKTAWSQTPFLHRLHQLLMRDRLETVGDVRLDHPPATPPGLIDEHLQGVVRRPFRPEPKRTGQHVSLEDRLEHDLDRGLHDPVTHRRDGQRTLLGSTRLGYEHPACRRRPIAAVPQVVGHLVEQPGHPVLLDHG